MPHPAADAGERVERSARLVRESRARPRRPRGNRGNGNRGHTADRRDRRTGGELRAAHERLRLPDAIVLATARDLGGDLLTYDDRLARMLPSRTSSRRRRIAVRANEGRHDSRWVRASVRA
ncbi:MAG: PIN domain-containing protein [Solirubrobacteraceae bacterium]